MFKLAEDLSHEKSANSFLLSTCAILIDFEFCFSRIYPDQLTTLGGLTAYPFATASAQPQNGVRYITATTPHGLTPTGQPTGGYTFG
jgi:hypothetical protein